MTYLVLVIQLMWLIIIASVVAAFIWSGKARDRKLRHETRLEIIRRCRQITQNGEVTYLSVRDIENILNEVRNTKILSESRFKNRKKWITILLFMTAGLIAALLFYLLYREEFSSNHLKDQVIIDEECDKILERLKELEESGEVNYFSVDDIESQAEQETVVHSY